MIDDDSLVIGYDTARGEPRGKLGTVGAGDCVACNRCVQVCPTGIDIRHGLQLECVGCAACIDACDDVMTKVHKPKGLIRYDSQSGLAGQKTQWGRPRILIYSVLFLIGVGVTGWALSTVKTASFGVTRMTGAPYFVTNDAVRNQFLVRMVNKQSTPVTFHVQLNAGSPLQQNGLTEPVTVGPLGEDVRPLIVLQPRRDYQGPFAFTLTMQDATGAVALAKEVEFLGPDARLLREEENEKAARQ
jgi:cytochrome c oxidase accessory protein FixG